MKSTGIVRTIDDLGRVTIPKEIRKARNIKNKDPVEIFVDGELIILAKPFKGCVFCDELDAPYLHKGKAICRSCLKTISEAVEFK